MVLLRLARDLEDHCIIRQCTFDERGAVWTVSKKYSSRRQIWL